MAHFYASAKGRAVTDVGRIGTVKTGVRASAASYKLGVSVYGEFMQRTQNDLFAVHFDGGSGGNARAGRVNYFHDDTGSHVEPDIEFVQKITDKVWREVLSHPEVAQKLRAMLFLNMDKLL